jgi:hypothetical protein
MKEQFIQKRAQLEFKYKNGKIFFEEIKNQHTKIKNKFTSYISL